MVADLARLVLVMLSGHSNGSGHSDGVLSVLVISNI